MAKNFLTGGGDKSVTTTSFNKNVTGLGNQIAKKAGSLLDRGKGFNPYTGQPYTDMSSQTTSALQQMQQLAGQGNPFYQPAADFTGGLIGGDYAHDTSGFSALYGQNPNALAQNVGGIASGAQGITVNGQLQSLLNAGMPNAAQQYGGGIASGDQSQTAIDQYGRRIAAGNKGIDTEAAYRDLMGRVDPEFENVVQNTANDVGDQIQRQFGGASFGSGSNADYLTKGIGDVVSKMRSDNFYNNINTQRGMLGDITGVQNQNINNILGASGMLSSEQGNNLSRQLSAAGLISGEQLAGLNAQSNILGQMGGFQNANIQNQMAAAGALSGEQQQGFNNNRGILGDVANLNQQSLTNQMQGVGMAPSVYGQQYLPSQIMAGVGGAYDAQSQRELDALMQQYFMRDNQGWNRLNAATGVLGGAAGGTGSTQTQQVQEQSNPLGSIAGGAVLASQILPAILSDVRAKTDIRRVGTLDNGLPVYVYRYKGAPTFHMGVMAQEVLDVHPEAVANVGGLLAVDYSKVA